MLILLLTLLLFFFYIYFFFFFNSEKQLIVMKTELLKWFHSVMKAWKHTATKLSLPLVLSPASPSPAHRYNKTTLQDEPYSLWTQACKSGAWTSPIIFNCFCVRQEAM